MDPAITQYEEEIHKMQRTGEMSLPHADWGFLYGEWSVGQSDFEKAFFISVQKIKKRAELLNADAVVGMRQDVDLDTNSFAFFYLQIASGWLPPSPFVPKSSGLSIARLQHWHMLLIDWLML